jgi:NADPH:quinone reductase-like Zn-dependent oxidoreductase
MKAFIIKAGSTSLDGLQLVEKDKPKAGPGEILVAMKAASINFRDLLIPAGQYFGGPVQEDTIPLSDGAGEVIAIGDGVTRFKKGDRVAGTFFRNYIDGPAAPIERPSLGSPVDGVLAEYVVFNQEDAVHIPANLSYTEASTLPCAGVTAWHSLMVAGNPITKGDTVLLLGTGGVSLCALQIAKAAGAKIIITSSSNEKLAKAEVLGASGLINYKTTPDWHEEVMKQTEGLGVNCVVEVGGAGTLNNSMQSLAHAGKIALIGVLSGSEGNPRPHALMLKGASMHGIFVGNRSMFEQLNKFVEANDIHPVIESMFSFDDAIEAFHLMKTQGHFGKIVINF